MSEEEEQIPQRITILPDPPSETFPLTVCYDFYGRQADEVVLSLDFSGSNTGMSIKLTRDAPCTDVTIPAGSSTVLIEDQSGQSKDLARVIGP